MGLIDLTSNMLQMYDSDTKRVVLVIRQLEKYYKTS